MNIPSPSPAVLTEGGRREYSYQLAWVSSNFMKNHSEIHSEKRGKYREINSRKKGAL